MEGEPGAPKPLKGFGLGSELDLSPQCGGHRIFAQVGQKQQLSWQTLAKEKAARAGAGGVGLVMCRADGANRMQELGYPRMLGREEHPQGDKNQPRSSFSVIMLKTGP